MFLREYITYWWRLAFVQISNWSLSQLLIPPSILGFIHAKLDISHGKTKVYYCGLKPLWHMDAEKVLFDLYQIQYENLQNHDHPEWHETYKNAYNRVTAAAIRQKFGLDIVELCLTQTEFQYRSKQRIKGSASVQIVA
jgi:hypothetical protein